MRDWGREVSRALANAKLPAADREEVARELAGYLEDVYNAARSRGLGDSAAIECAFAELHEDARLGPKLRRARREGNMMNERIKRFWFPSLTVLLASTACLMILLVAGLRPYFTMKGDLPLVIYLPWLAILPFLGAGGACWSRWRRGGQPVPVGRFLSVLKLFASFVGVFIASLLVAVPVCTALGLLAPTVGFFRALTGAILSWVAIPGLALFLGVLPFLRDSSAGPRIALGEEPHA